MATEIRVPTLGESVSEATVGKWFKKVGDTITADEPVVELETDKVTIEVPAPAAGRLAEIAVKDGETVGVGALLGQQLGSRRSRRHLAFLHRIAAAGYGSRLARRLLHRVGAGRARCLCDRLRFRLGCRSLLRSGRD
ncbi:MAG: dihydrolipoamide succinyltransferase, partial [Rhizobiaceae bacterium]|nr:dihydrolipoamide succinyltransferase [Rhizobiaceae bacterium]